jgi:hypothetical protein
MNNEVSGEFRLLHNSDLYRSHSIGRRVKWAWHWADQECMGMNGNILLVNHILGRTRWRWENNNIDLDQLESKNTRLVFCNLCANTVHV